MSPEKNPHKPRLCTASNAVLLVKALIVLLCACALFVQSGRCLVRYLDKATSTILSVRPTGQAPFMAFTLCPDYHMAYNDSELRRRGTTKSKYQRGDYDTGSLEEPREVYQAVIHGLESLLKVKHRQWLSLGN